MKMTTWRLQNWWRWWLYDFRVREDDDVQVTTDVCAFHCLPRPSLQEQQTGRRYLILSLVSSIPFSYVLISVTAPKADVINLLQTSPAIPVCSAQAIFEKTSWNCRPVHYYAGFVFQSILKPRLIITEVNQTKLTQNKQNNTRRASTCAVWYVSGRTASLPWPENCWTQFTDVWRLPTGIAKR